MYFVWYNYSVLNLTIYRSLLQVIVNPKLLTAYFRFKGKSRIMPTVPNQPSEASAHWMWELAKTILNKAGGTSSTSQFIQPSNTNQHTGPHRNLQLCSFQIGLYALGLQNCVAPNWLSRTYSSHVSWITGKCFFLEFH